MKGGADTANVIIDMSDYKEEFLSRQWVQLPTGEAAFVKMEPGMSSGANQEILATDDEEVNAMLEETRGCAVMDSGATVMCSSTLAAEEIQMQRINREELGTPTIRDSDRRFRLADGRFNDSSKMVEQPITAGCCQVKP